MNLFTPQVKRKKGFHNKLVIPFPDAEYRCKAIFTGISVEIFNVEAIRTIYENGFYGKGSKSRGIPQVLTRKQAEDCCSSDHIPETLCLSLEEAFFLGYFHRFLEIVDLEERPVEWKVFLNDALNINQYFIESLASYLYLKSKGWVVKSGLKFGGNYLIYRKGPRYYHASFVVVLLHKDTNSCLESKNLKGLQRVAETSDKNVLLLTVEKPASFEMNTLADISQLKISEMIVQRFNYTSYIQNKKLTK